MKSVKKATAVILSLTVILMSAFAALSVYSESAYSQGATITFGSYPQSKVNDSGLIGKLNDSVTDSDFISYGYKEGDNNPGSEAPSDQMKYVDVIYEGEKYRGVRIYKYRPYRIYDANENPSTVNPQLQYEKYNVSGITYWFRFEPISWTVLDPDTGLVICTKVLDAQPYFNSFITAETNERLYVNSYIRTYVNSVFHDLAFGKSENMIYTDSNQKDKIFLADTSILTSYIYDSDMTFNDRSRRAETTDYSYINGSSWVSENNVNYNLYMLGDDCTNGLYIISAFGKLLKNNNNDYYRALGYRPCMYLDLNHASNRNAVHYMIDGEEIRTEYYSVNEPISVYTPKRDGYTFNGWDYSLPQTMPDHDITVNAEWTVHNHTFKLNSTSGKFKDGTTVKQYNLDYGTALEDYVETPSYQGYDFDEWDILIPDKMPDNDIIASAKWKEATDTPYTVEIYKEKPINSSTEGVRIYDKEVTEKTGTTNSTVSETPEELNDFIFDETKSNTETTISPDGTSTIKLYYTRRTGIVSFYIGEGYPSVNREYKYGQDLTYPDIPTVNGKAGKWDTVQQKFDGTNSTFNVIWTPESHSISFNTDGGNNINNIVADYGSEITPPENPVKEGYTFVEWEPKIPETMPYTDITCKAIWKANSHNVTWIADGNTVKSENYDFGTKVTNPEAQEKPGYTFSGWSTDDFTMPDNDVTVTGTYTANAYTVTFISEGKTDTVTVKYGEKITVPDAGIKQDYTFKGWDNEIPDSMPAGNLTFTAVYEITPYIRIFGYQNRTEKYKTTITFHADFAGYNESDIIWVNGDGNEIGRGKSCKVTDPKYSYSVQAKVVSNGTEIDGSQIENVTIKRGFFDIILSFFVRLFNPAKYIIDQW